MFAILSSQLAFSAASTLAKKSFEFGITSSLRGLCVSAPSGRDALAVLHFQGTSRTASICATPHLVAGYLEVVVGPQPLFDQRSWWVLQVTDRCQQPLPADRTV